MTNEIETRHNLSVVNLARWSGDSPPEWERDEMEPVCGWDLATAMRYHAPPFDKDAITEVLLIQQGENDGKDWEWLIRLKTGERYFASGGCDYTGWDCQSWMDYISLRR